MGRKLNSLSKRSSQKGEEELCVCIYTYVCMYVCVSDLSVCTFLARDILSWYVGRYVCAYHKGLQGSLLFSLPLSPLFSHHYIHLQVLPKRLYTHIRVEPLVQGPTDPIHTQGWIHLVETQMFQSSKFDQRGSITNKLPCVLIFSTTPTYQGWILFRLRCFRAATDDCKPAL